MRARATRRAAVALITATSAALASPRFEVTDAAALTDLHAPDSLGAGVALADLDGDGDDDLVVVNAGRSVTSLRSDAGGLVAWQRSLEPRHHPSPWAASAVAAGDVDGDGAVDLVLGARDGVYLLHGRGDGNFDDWSPVAFDGLWHDVGGIALADVDGDGLLDVYVAGYIAAIDWPRHGCDRDALFLQRPRAPWVRVELPDRDAGCGLGAVFFDADGDGDPDPMVVNDFGPLGVPNHVWRNDGIGADGRLRIRDTGRAPGVSIYGMGLAVGDADGDGVLDVAHTSIGRAPMLRGLGDGRFEDVTERYGVHRTLGFAGRRVTWGAFLGDLDGDGTTDLLQTAGDLEGDPGLDLAHGGNPGFFFGGGAGPWREETLPLDASVAWRGLAAGDLDGDAAPDLAIAAAADASPAVLRNRAVAPWLSVVPRGTVSPREARGAVVTLRCGDGSTRTAVIATGGNFACSSAPRAFFSLARCASPEVAVRWPSGVTTRTAVTAPGTLRVDEPAWLAVDRAVVAIGATATVTVHPAGVGSDVAIAAITPNLLVSPTSRRSDGAFSATLTRAGPGDAWASIRVDGTLLPRGIRLADGDAPRMWITPAAVSPGRPADIVVVASRTEFAALTPSRGTLTEAPSFAGDAYWIARVDDAPTTLRAAFADGTAATLDVPRVDDLDPELSHVVLRPGFRDAASATPGSFEAMFEFFTPLGDSWNGDPASVTLVDASGAVLHTLPLNPFGRRRARTAWTDGPFDVRVADRVVVAGVRLETLPAGGGAERLSTARTRLVALQSTLVADGTDATDVLFVPRSAEGHAVPVRDVAWSADGCALGLEIPGDPADATVRREVRAGTVAGSCRITARAGANTWSADLALMPAEAVDAEVLEVCASAALGSTADTATVDIAVMPRRANGLLAGGNRAVEAASELGMIALVERAGTFRATMHVAAGRDTVTVRATERGTRVPAAPREALTATLALPFDQLFGTGWVGNLRCARAARTPMVTVPVDAGPAMPDAATAPTVPAPAPSCGCSTSDSRVGGGWIALALAVLVFPRRRAGHPRYCRDVILR